MLTWSTTETKEPSHRVLRLRISNLPPALTLVQLKLPTRFLLSFNLFCLRRNDMSKRDQHTLMILGGIAFGLYLLSNPKCNRGAGRLPSTLSPTDSTN